MAKAGNPLIEERRMDVEPHSRRGIMRDAQ